MRRFVAALKAITRAVELEDSSIRRYQLACTQLTVGLHEEAVELLGELVRGDAPFVPVPP